MSTHLYHLPHQCQEKQEEYKGDQILEDFSGKLFKWETPGLVLEKAAQSRQPGFSAGGQESEAQLLAKQRDIG